MDMWNKEKLQEEKITVKTVEGQTLECEVLFTFDDESGKSYMVYTDNSLDEEGNTRVYASIYEMVAGEMQLKEIESQEELEKISDVIRDLQEEVKTEMLGDEDFDEWIESIERKIYEYAKSKNGKLLGELSLEILYRAVEEEIPENILCIFKAFDKVKQENMTKDYFNIAIRALSEKKNLVAEELLWRVSEFEVAEGRYMLAHMIRRGEVREPSQYSLTDAIKLLRQGIQAKNAFALTNMALLWALSFGKEEDWHLADELISKIDGTCDNTIVSYWYNMAKNGDVEGSLVHLWLLRHKKIVNSKLGSKEQLYLTVKKVIKNLPDFMNVGEGNYRRPVLPDFKWDTDKK